MLFNPGYFLNIIFLYQYILFKLLRRTKIVLNLAENLMLPGTMQ